MNIISDLSKFLGRTTASSGEPVRNTIQSTSLAGGIFKSQGVMYIGNKQVRIDNKEPKLVINNGNYDNILIGKRADGTYGFDIAKDGYDVNSATNANLFYSDRFIKVAYKFSKPASTPSIAANGIFAEGLLQYYVDSGVDIVNFTQYINFYKETNLTIESCLIQTKWYDGYALDQTTRVRPGACTLFLNPSTTKQTEGSYMSQRFTGGTTLAAITPNADLYTNTETCIAAEIALITDGWNQIAVQIDSSTDDALANWGTVAFDVSIKGYLT